MIRNAQTHVSFESNFTYSTTDLKRNLASIETIQYTSECRKSDTLLHVAMIRRRTSLHSHPLMMSVGHGHVRLHSTFQKCLQNKTTAETCARAGTTHAQC
jgi:hypothetical protein